VKHIYFFVSFLFFNGVFSVTAQDIIVLKDGNMIEAKVMEISPTEIRYKRIDHFDGPMIVIPAVNVLSIRYENGTTEIISSTPERIEIIKRQPGMETDRLYFSVSADPSGFLLYGPSLLTEFSYNHFNTQIYINFPSLGLVVKSDGFGIGFAVSFNYLWHTRIGAFYLGGLFDYNGYNVKVPGLIKLPNGKYTDGVYDYKSENPWRNSIIFALNTGFKFVLPSGICFNTGGNIGLVIADDFSNHKTRVDFSIRPNITMGYSF